MDPGFPVVPVGPWTFFVAALDKVQYDYHPHTAQTVYHKCNKGFLALTVLDYYSCDKGILALTVMHQFTVAGTKESWP